MPEPRKLRVAIVLVVGGTAVAALWIGLGLGGRTVVRYADDLMTVAAAGLAAGTTVRAWRTSDRSRAFWGLLSAACISWTVAEAGWAAYDLGTGSVPDPSWADAGYLLAIPLTVLALLRHPGNAGRSTAGRWRGVLDGFAVAGAGLLLSWVLVLGTVVRARDLSTLGGLVAVAYPVGDVVVLVLVVMTVRSMRGRAELALWAVLTGLICMAAADTVYAYLTEVRSFATGGLVDVGWITAYLAIAAGAVVVPTADMAAPEEPVAQRRSAALASVTAPYVVVLPALVVIAVAEARRVTMSRGQWALTVILVVLVLCRQAVAVFDNRPRGGGPVRPSMDLSGGGGPPAPAGRR